MHNFPHWVFTTTAQVAASLPVRVYVHVYVTLMQDDVDSSFHLGIRTSNCVGGRIRLLTGRDGTRLRRHSAIQHAFAFQMITSTDKTRTSTPSSSAIGRRPKRALLLQCRRGDGRRKLTRRRRLDVVWKRRRRKVELRQCRRRLPLLPDHRLLRTSGDRRTAMLTARCDIA